MSDLVEGSDSMSMDQNIQVHANREGENQIFIPCWEEEGSSSTYLNHLREEVRILKSKCTHLENHLEENHREFNSLNQLYLIAQTNEKKLLRENDELKRRYKEVSQELQQTGVQLENAIAEANFSSKKDLEWRESSKQMREQHFQLQERVRVLGQENEMLRKRAVSVSEGEEGKWKQVVDEQSRLAEARLQRQNEHFSFQLEILQKDLETANQALRTVQTNFKSYKEETRLFRERVNSEREEAMEKENKAIASQAALEKQERELKASWERTRSEREQLEEENKMLRRQLTEQGHRLATQHKMCQEKQLKYKQSQQEIEEKEREIKDLNDNLGKNKTKSNFQEKEISDLKNQLEEYRQNVEYIERQRRDCREEIESVRRTKDLEIQTAREESQAKVRELKAESQQERNMNQQKIATLENEVQSLKGKVVNSGSVQRPTSEQAPSQTVIKQLEMARNRINELEELSLLSSDCGHFDQIKKNQEQLRKIKKDKQNLELMSEDLKSSLESAHQEAVKMRERNIKLQKELKKMESEYQDSVASKECLEKQLQGARENERQLVQRARLSSGVLEGIVESKTELQQKQNECRSLRKLLADAQQELKLLSNGDEESIFLKAQMTEKENKILMLQSSQAEQGEIHYQRVTQLERSLMEKGSKIALQEIRISDLTKEVGEWEVKYKAAIQDLQHQEGLVSKMKSEIKELSQRNVSVPNEREVSRDTSPKLERELKNEEITKLEMTTGEEQTLQDLEEEYQRELTALKRLVEYRAGKEESRNVEEIRRKSQMEIQGVLVEYRIMQEEMMKLRETVLGSHEMGGMREWDSLLLEKDILIEKVGLWERKYEELRCLFQAKLSSKEQTINLLTLRIGNMQMAGRGACYCT